MFQVFGYPVIRLHLCQGHFVYKLFLGNFWARRKTLLTTFPQMMKMNFWAQVNLFLLYNKTQTFRSNPAVVAWR